MKKITTIIVLISCNIFFISCSKKATNQPPSVVALIYPSENLLCIDNIIAFNWSAAIDPENDKVQYNIVVATDRALTNVIENRTISDRQITIELQKETAYYWKIDALDIDNDQGTSSETFAFLTTGEGTENHAPFTADSENPENDTVVTGDIIDLTWNAVDVNTTDTLTYEVFFGENSDLQLLDDSVVNTTFSVAVESGKSYSWRIDVKDQNGAKSIGQVWNFTVN